MIDDTAALRALIEALPSPVWARDDAGKLIFVNAAYARAVEAKDAAEAVERGIELFDRAARDELLRAHEAAKAITPAGCRRSSPAAAAASTCITVPAARGSAGIGIDATEAETHARRARAHDRGAPAHARPARHRRRHLRLRPEARFYNAAYRSLWDLDAGFLDQAPTDSAVLDQLRAARKLPDEQDFRQWQGRAARGLPGDRAEGACVAPAGRPHHAGGHHAQSGRRRDLSVRRRHRTARSRAPLSTR